MDLRTWQRVRTPTRWAFIAFAFVVPVVVGLALKPWLERLLGEWWWLTVVLLAQGATTAAAILTKRVASAAVSRPPQYHVQFLDATTRHLPRIRDLARLLLLTVRLVVREVGAGHAAVYVEESQTYRRMASHGLQSSSKVPQLEASSPLIQWLLEHRRPLTRDEGRRAHPPHGAAPKHDHYRRLHLILDNLEAELIVPSFQGKRLLGFLALGKRADRRGPYSDEEIAALLRLAQGCAIALDNARSYQQLKATAQKLHAAQDRLLRQERMVASGRIAMGLAHEVKNPLAAIKTFAEFLPERYDDPAFREEFARVVGKEVDRISRIVESLSDFAKPLLLKFEPTDVQKLLKETVALLSNDCLKRNITIQQIFESRPIMAPADANQLKQAFLNLCVNALDAMEHGGTLSVSCQYRGGEAVIRISDTGIGIPKENLAVLFDPFFTTKDGGMGLGLAMVRQIVEQHFGTIHVESELGMGSAFEIRLPWAMKLKGSGTTALLEPAGGQPTSADTEEPGGPPADDVDERPAVPVDMLIVDDEPKIRLLLKEAFEAKGCRVRVAASGEETFALLSQNLPQLVLLDLKLQDMDGFEVLKRIKSRHPHLPVIVITGSFGEEVDQFVQELGAVACLHKPLNLAVLRRRVFDLATSSSGQTHTPSAG